MLRGHGEDLGGAHLALEGERHDGSELLELHLEELGCELLVRDLRGGEESDLAGVAAGEEGDERFDHDRLVPAGEAVDEVRHAHRDARAVLFVRAYEGIANREQDERRHVFLVTLVGHDVDRAEPGGGSRHELGGRDLDHVSTEAHVDEDEEFERPTRRLDPFERVLRAVVADVEVAELATGDLVVHECLPEGELVSPCCIGKVRNERNNISQNSVFVNLRRKTNESLFKLSSHILHSSFGRGNRT